MKKNTLTEDKVRSTQYKLPNEAIAAMQATPYPRQDVGIIHEYPLDEKVKAMELKSVALSQAAVQASSTSKLV